MSLNPYGTGFRKVEVDQCERVDPVPDNLIKEYNLDFKDLELRLQRGKGVDVLKTILSSPPAGSKDPSEKDGALSLVIRTMLSIRRGQIEQIVEELDSEQKQCLMKYIYRGFEHPKDGSSSHLLKWHEHTFASTGLGTIMRVFTDRKTI